MNRSNWSCFSSTRFNTAAAARNLNVLHTGKVLPIGNRDVYRWQYPAQPHRFERRFAPRQIESDSQNRLSIPACLRRATKAKLLPSMIRRMAFLHRDEDPPACGANFSSSSQCSLDGRTVIRYLNNI